MIAQFYRLLTDIGGPVLRLYIRRRAARGLEERPRLGEKWGNASRPRPDGRIIWCHAASVGESVTILRLIDRIHHDYPDVSILVTTGTVTAARMLDKRLPSFAVHQYMPLDRRAGLKKFLGIWQPFLVLWVESELWPNALGLLG